LPYPTGKTGYKPQQEVFYVIDEISEFGQLAKVAPDTNLEFVLYQGEQAKLDELVLEEEAAGYFVLNQAFLKTGQVQVHSAEKRVMFKELQGLLSNLLQGLRVQEIGIEREQVAYLTSTALLSSVQIGGESSGDQPNRIGVSIALAGIVLFLISRQAPCFCKVPYKRNRIEWQRSSFPR